MNLFQLLEAAVDVKTLDIDSIKPEQKDHDRVEGFHFRKQFGRVTFKGNNTPFASEAIKMAKSIKDPTKLVRRAKAVVQLHGSRDSDRYGGSKENEIWAPFADALKRLGFSREQIQKIEASKK